MDTGSEHKCFPNSYTATAYGLSDCHWGQSQYSLGADTNSIGSWTYRPEFIPSANKRQAAGSAIWRKPYWNVFKIIIRNHLPLPLPKETEIEAFLNLVPLAVNISATFLHQWQFWIQFLMAKSWEHSYHFIAKIKHAPVTVSKRAYHLGWELQKSPVL